METQIHRLRLGHTNCYLIKEEGVILIDGGEPNKINRFVEKINEISIEPKEISLILVTHCHWDHIGSLSEIKDLAGCRVAANRHEKDWAEQALVVIPPAIGVWGKLLYIFFKFYKPFIKFRKTVVDVVLEDKEFSLKPFGINGKVLYTPGHTYGSMSVLLDTGDAFIGDLAMNAFPMRTGLGVPRFAEDINAIKESWRLVLEKGAKQIYPSHGRPFKAEELLKQVSDRGKL